METPKDIIAKFREHLETTGKSTNTVKAYRHDVASFAGWFELTTGESFSPGAI
jgi:site-specific recombinase XerD